MPTFRHGKLSHFSLGSAGAEATLTNLSPYLTDVQFPRPVDVAETSTFGTTAKTYVIGLYSSAFSFTGRYDETIDGQLSSLLGSEKPVGFRYGPGGSANGRRSYLGAAYITSYDVQGGVGDMVGISLQAQVTGAVDDSVFTGSSTATLPASASTTVTVGSNAVDVATFTGSATLNVTAIAGFAASNSALLVATTNGVAVISYGSATSTTFTNCNTIAGSGTLATGGVVTQ